jgi:hypothetical protein
MSSGAEEPRLADGGEPPLPPRRKQASYLANDTPANQRPPRNAQPNERLDRLDGRRGIEVEIVEAKGEPGKKTIEIVRIERRAA